MANEKSPLQGLQSGKEQGQDRDFQVDSQSTPGDFGLSQNNDLSDSELLEMMNQIIIYINDGVFAIGLFKFRIKQEKDKETPTIILQGLYKDGFLEFLHKMGYRKRRVENSLNYKFVLIEKNIIEEVTPEMMKERVYLAFIANKRPLDASINDIASVWTHEAQSDVYGNQYHLIFNANFLEHLATDATPEMRDTPTAAYFPFRNVVIKVTATGSEIVRYEDLNHLVIWKSHINKHSYHSTGLDILDSKNHFLNFSSNVCNGSQDRFTALCSGLGYVMHSHNSSVQGQALMLYDEVVTDPQNPQGGTGKGIILQALGHIRETAIIDGKRFSDKDRFSLQDVNPTTRIVGVDDMNKDIPFESSFSFLTDGLTIEKKHQATIRLSPEKSPKWVFTSNTILGGGGSSTRRRQFIVELSDYYSRQIITGTEKPVEAEHGGELFGSQWDDVEWGLFFEFMFLCVQEYLNNGLQPYRTINIEANKIAQNLPEDFVQWLEETSFELEKSYITSDYYYEYKSRFDPDGMNFSQRKFTTLIKKYANIKGWKWKTWQEGSMNTKVSKFKFLLI